MEWKSFDEKTQEYEVETASGEISKIAASEVSKLVTPEEEEEFLRLRNRKAS